MSFRYGWFSHTARSDPLPSSIAASKILKPGRRVDRRPLTSTRPETAAVWPGFSDAIGCSRLRSS